MANKFLTGIDEEMYPKYWQARVKKDPNVYQGFRYLSLDEERLKYSVPNPVNDAPVMESDKFTKMLNQLANDYFIKIIAGESKLEDTYEYHITTIIYINVVMTGEIGFNAGQCEGYACVPCNR